MGPKFPKEDITKGRQLPITSMQLPITSMSMANKQSFTFKSMSVYSNIMQMMVNKGAGRILGFKSLGIPPSKLSLAGDNKAGRNSGFFTGHPTKSNGIWT